MKTSPFAFLADQLESRLPEALRPVRQEIKNASRRMMDAQLERFDLVPRAEFEAQHATLQALKARIAALESRLENPPENPA